MEKGPMIAVGVATVAFVGLGALFLSRRAKAATLPAPAPVAPTAKPIPADAPPAPVGVVTDALEIDNATHFVNVRNRDAQELVTLLNNYELVPFYEQPGGPSDTLAGSFDLAPKAEAPGLLHRGYPAAKWLADAAKAGFDILINDRLTALLKGNLASIPRPATPTKFTTDILVIGPADRPLYVKYGDGKDADHQYAILVRGEFGGNMQVPSPPGGHAMGAILSDDTDAAKKAASDAGKAISMGIALSRAQRAQQRWGGIRH